VTAVLAIGTAAALILMVFRLQDLQEDSAADRPVPTREGTQKDEDAWELV
jgi:hypothetical protein